MKTRFLAKGMLSVILTLAMVFGAVPANGLVIKAKAAVPADAITIDGKLTINNSNRSTYNNKTITGTYHPSAASFGQKGAIVIDGGTTNLTINELDINIVGDHSTGVSGIYLKNNATLNLTILGENSIYAAGEGAGICVPRGCTLVITDESTGSLTVDGGCNINDSASEGGAGIGAEGRYQTGLGSIVINGGTINAIGGATGLPIHIGAAAIGGACDTVSEGSIEINGGSINAEAINGNAAIGGAFSGSVERIRITGGDITATVSSVASKGAGIGCGANTHTERALSCGDIEITGGTINTNGNIGYGDSLSNSAGNSGGSVTITGRADVHAPNIRRLTLNATIYDDMFTTNGTYNDAQVSLTSAYHGNYRTEGDITVTENKKGTAAFRFYLLESLYDSAEFTVTYGSHTWTKSSYLGNPDSVSLVFIGSYTAENISSRVTYLDENGREQLTNTVPGTLPSSGNVNSGWYAVNGVQALSGQITINGTVNLILCDDAKLNSSSGIIVAEGKTLNIYAQSRNSETMGKIDTTGEKCAGIGVKGTLVINGGNITATGTQDSEHFSHSSGIGGWGEDDTFGTITINDGIVNATSSGIYSAFGIGFGDAYAGSDSNGTININGGKVTASYYGIGGSSVNLGWKNSDDTLHADGDNCYRGTISFADGQFFRVENTNTLITPENIKNNPRTTFVPAYKISFDANGGSGSMGDLGVEPNVKYTLPECGFTAPDYMYFDHWEIGGTSYAVGTDVFITGNTEIKAVWSFEPAAEPTISSQPEGFEVIQGSATGNTLEIGASAETGHTVSYQWYSNTTNTSMGGTRISGATESVYTVPTNSVGTKYYYCVVTATREDNNQTATVTSNVVTATVRAKSPQTLTFENNEVTKTYGDAAFTNVVTGGQGTVT